MLELRDDKDAKTSSDANSLLNAICDFEFVLCLVCLRVILSNVNALCRYLQSSTMDVISARKTAEGAVMLFKVAEPTEASILFGKWRNTMVT